ncbi:YybH family protein [Thiobacter aerophilum]|uniref:Nuclear transport factor 2 family protein n=1 Tax=Thiobacter aerophilum TaxID=3121275 RepID=A0ABV0EF13_9BURK
MTTRFPSPEDAEAAFYRAFERNDLDAMLAVWDEAEDVICVHPMGSPLKGVRAVAQSWQEILGAQVAMRFGIEPIQITRQQGLAIHIVKEHIMVPDGKPVAPMSATNVYRETPAGWRMILHHASPAPGVLSGPHVGRALH